MDERDSIVKVRLITLVQDQLAWYSKLIASRTPDHPRYKPSQVALYERKLRGHQELLEFLQNLPDRESSAEPERAHRPAPVVNSKAPKQDLSDLPPELLQELSASAAKSNADPVVDLIAERGGTASLDDILIDLYRKHGEVNKRNILANRLYRLSKRGEIWILPGRKGLYSTLPPDARSADPQIRLFDEAAE